MVNLNVPVVGTWFLAGKKRNGVKLFENKVPWTI
jgi:hypothetical protein